MPPTKAVKANTKTALHEKWPQVIGIGAILLSVLAIHFVLISIVATLLTGFVGELWATIIGLAVGLLVCQFFGMPLIYGALRWFWFTVGDADVPLCEIFCYFSRGGEYLRALSLSFRVFVRIVTILFLCFLPSLIVLAVRHPYTYDLLNFSMPYWASSIWALGNVLTAFGTVLSAILLLRYFAAPILVINNPSITPQEALHLSVILSKNANGRTLGFILSFIGWGLLSLLAVPLLFTLPYFLGCYCVYCRFLIHHYNRTVSITSNTYSGYPDRL